MHLSCDRPSLFRVTVSLSATLPQQAAFPTIYSPSGLLSLQLASMREREVLMEPRSYHSLGEGWCGGEDERWAREKGGLCRGLLQLCRYERLNGKIPPDATGAAHQVSSWLVRRTARFQSFIHGLARTGALALALATPHRQSFVTALPQLSALDLVAVISV